MQSYFSRLSTLKKSGKLPKAADLQVEEEVISAVIQRGNEIPTLQKSLQSTRTIKPNVFIRAERFMCSFPLFFPHQWQDSLESSIKHKLG